MARIGGRIPSLWNPGLASPALRVLILAVMLLIPSRTEAARLSRYLTAKDLSRPLLLDQNGRELQLPSPIYPHPSVPAGSTPTYLAVRLYGGEHLPISTAAIDAGAQAGSNGTGPLDLNTVVIGELNAALKSSGFALVEAPSQNYLVEYLPHRARSHKADSTSSGSTDQKTSSSTNSTLSKLVTASQWEKWAGSGYSDLKNLLNMSSSSSKHRTSKPITIQAQILEPDSQTSSQGSVLPAAIPEPSGWMIFALLLGASGLARAKGREWKRAFVIRGGGRLP
jgi:hypothetical protein